MLELLRFLDRESVQLIVWFFPTLFFIYLFFRIVVEPAVKLFAKMVSVNDACADKIEEMRKEMVALRREFQTLREFCARKGSYVKSE